MIGREDDVKEIAAALIGATNLIVAGPRRTGKTSVCQAAVTRAKAQRHYTASLDLFRIADAAELAETLAVAPTVRPHTGSCAAPGSSAAPRSAPRRRRRR